jgi:small-conductance mechanosensitive channel
MNQLNKFMEMQSIQWLESVAILLVYVLVYFANKTIINKALKNTPLQRTRRKIIIKVLQLFTTLAFFILLAAVWGLKQSEIAVFASTILTALGIAFFAQWSLLSNITSSVLLFFNHPLKLGDTIKVLDKDYPVEGEVIELTYFFVHLKTSNGEIVTIPNSLFLQKSIAVIEK